MRTAVLSAILSLGLAAGAHAQDDGKCAKQQAALDAVTAKYERLYDELENRPVADADLSVTGNVKWTTKNISYDLPSSKMKRRSMAFNTPQVTVRTRTISFKKPVTKMARRKTGERPSVTCHRFHCTMRWIPIYASFPEVTMEATSISTSVPEFSFKRTDISYSAPEFTMIRKDVSFKYPEYAGHPTDPGSERKEEFEALQAAEAKEAAPLIKVLYECQQGDLTDLRITVAGQFDDGLKKLNAAIDYIQSSGGNPAAVDGENEPANLLEERGKLVDQRVAALAEIDAGLEAISKARRDTFEAYGIKDESA